MMQNNYRCQIYLWDQLVGEMVLVKESVYFKYNEAFDLNISPIALPLSSAQYNFDTLDFQHKLPGVFSDSLPDNFGMKVIDNYFAQIYTNFTPNIIDKLLFIGDVSLGALKYKPNPVKSNTKSIPIMLREVRQFQKVMLEDNTYDSIRNVIDMYKTFSPVGGAKEKLILSYNEQKQSFYIGETKKGDKALIVKIDESEYPHYGAASIIEYIYSLVAASCGINIPKTYLFDDTLGYKHFAIERFDIDINADRLHTHTLSGLLNLEKSTSIDYANIFTLAKQQLLVSQEDIDELFRRMVFNYTYNNNDDHLKNTTFLMDKHGRWKLSPAYDLTYNNTKWQREMILKINKKLSSQVNYSDFAQLGDRFGVDYKTIIKEVQNSVLELNKLIEKYNHKNIQFDLLEIKQIRVI